MMLNIYQLHANPDQLKEYDRAHEKVPELIVSQYDFMPTQKQREELKKHKHVLAQDPKTAYFYARRVINDRFPEGENAIAQDPFYAYMYAIQLLQGRFPKGEDAISRDKQSWDAYKQILGIDDA